MATKKLTAKPSISVFFPCYNDEGSIAKLVNDASAVLRRIAEDWEVIVVDDGSSDNSRKILKALAKNNPKLKIVFHEKNRGYGGALKSGFRNATKELVFYTDGDGQYDVREIEKLLPRIADGIDVVQGYKLKRHDPFYRMIIGTLYHHFSRIVFNIKVKDIDCDFRLIRKKAMDGITLHYDSGVICVELVKKLQKKGARFSEIGVHHFPRLHGQSQFFNIRRVSKTLAEQTVLWWKLIILKQYD
ncbi:MAG: glycosyltransferase family 2 protein [Candidatus Curtissbacteria bacterium]|nr:glycosyltransferase family 2 protein [Candidatus Curtissbacteria bacterium]